MKAAQQMHRIRKIASRMSAGSFEKRDEMAMTRGAFGADSR
jgi:hypothetical protein